MSSTRITVADLAALVAEQQAQIAALTEAITKAQAAPTPAPASRPARHDTRPNGQPNPGVVSRRERSQGFYLFAIEGEWALVEGVANKAGTRTYGVRHVAMTGKGGREYVGTVYLADLDFADVQRDGTRLADSSVEAAKAQVLAGKPLPDPTKKRTPKAR